jgi:hypothetical protein
MHKLLAMAWVLAAAGSAYSGSPLAGSTYFGGTGADEITAVAIAPDGSIYVAGIAAGTVPTTGGAYDQTYNGGTDGFVARFNSTLTSLLSATMFGGAGDDGIRGIHVASNGQVCVAGYTFSSDLPTAGSAFDRTYNGAGDAFLAVFSADLSTLAGSTFLGGSGLDDATSVRQGAGSSFYAAGRTASANFPVPGSPYDTTFDGVDDAFVAKMTPGLDSLEAATYVGGGASDIAQALAISPIDQSVWIAATSLSTNYPVSGSAFDATRNGASDLVVTRLSASLGALLASTYVGPADVLSSLGLAVDASGRPYTACRTTSAAYPTRAGAYDTTLGGAADIAVSLLSSDLTNVVASTFVGGGGVDTALALTLDSSGVGVVGLTLSPDFPVTPGPVDGTYVGNVNNGDVVAMKFNASLSSLQAATCLRGNSGEDSGRALAVAPGGDLVVAGGTTSTEYPATPGAYDAAANGAADGFVTRWTLRPENTTGIDVESDGRSDLAICDTSTFTWYLLQSTAGFRQQQFGFGSCTPVQGDYNGDGRLDIGVYDPASATWYIQQPAGVTVQQFGFGTVVPVPADYDGDSRTDIAVYDPVSFTWYFLRSTAGFGLQPFGYGSVVPVPADYDGDGRADVAVFDRSNGTWYLLRSTAGFAAQQFGFSGVVPVPADYDGDGAADLGVYDRTRATWYLLRSRDGFGTRIYGVGSVVPVPADYDGDNRADTSVYDVSSGVWHIFQSRVMVNPDRSQQFGYAGAIPVLTQYTINRAFGFP